MNQTRVYLFQSQNLIERPIPEEIQSEFNEHWRERIADKHESLQFVGPITLGQWIKSESARFKTVTDEDIRADMREFYEEYLLGGLEESPEMYWLLDFPGASWLNMQLHDLRPTLPERYLSRSEGIFTEEGIHLPPDSTTPLAGLNDIIPTWTFFTKNEISDLKTIIEEFWKAPHENYWYEDEWKKLLTAHERHDYDWLAFYYMFG